MKFTAILTAVSAVLSAACLTVAMASPVEISEGKKLAAVLARADEADLKLTPQAAVTRGDLRYADQYGDYITDAFVKKSASNARQQLRELSTINRAALSAKDRIAFDVFQYQVEFVLRGHGEGIVKVNQHMPIDPVFGAHLQFAQFSSGEGIAPYKTLKDYQQGLKRIDGFVTFLDRAINAMRVAIPAGHVHHRTIVEKLIAQLDASLAMGVDKSPYLNPVNHFPSAAAFTATAKAKLTADYRQAIGGKINPALARLRDFLKSHYLPAARTGAPGLATMRDGARYYAYALEQHITSRITAEEIHALGLTEVARLRREMEKVREQVGFSGTLPAFFKYLQEDAKFKLASKEALLEHYRGIQARVDVVMPRLFSSVPKGRFEVRAVPAEQESSASGAYYVIGTPEGTRAGVFYVNTADLSTRTTPRATALFLHEAIPGHHLQGSLAQEDAALPAILRFSWNPGYGEGWALYAESLGDEMALYDDAYQRFGKLDMEIFRAARMVVDTGLHAQGWSREEAMKYLADNTSLDSATIEQEIDRYIVWPGQAPAYKIGELFIRKLRQRAETTLGARFDIRAFHDQVLNTGAIPLHVLEKKIDDWIVSRKQ